MKVAAMISIGMLGSAIARAAHGESHLVFAVVYTIALGIVYLHLLAHIEAVKR